MLRSALPICESMASTPQSSLSMSSNRSLKKPNYAQGGESRVSSVSVNSDTNNTSAARAVQDGAPLQPPLQDVDVSRSFPLQFGSTSPGFMKGMLQVPAPPKSDEKKIDQSHHDSFRAVPALPTIPSTSKQQVPKKTVGDHVNQSNTSKPQRLCIKITHPDTHEELRLDKRTDSYNVPPQSQPIPSFPPGHPINLYPNSYKAGSHFFPPSSSLPLTSTQINPSSQAPRFSYPVSQGPHTGPFVNPSDLNTFSVNKGVLPSHGIADPSNLEHAREVQKVIPSAPVQVTVKPASGSYGEKIAHESSKLPRPHVEAGLNTPERDSSLTSTSKDRMLGSNKGKSNMAKGKKKRKEILQKADAVRTTSDLYTTDKGPEENKETVFASSKSTSSNNLQPISIDAKMYSRDFLLKFAEQCADLPEVFVITSDIETLMVSSVTISRASLHSPRRIVDSPTGGSRPDRRMRGMGDEDKWSKFSGPVSSVHDLRLDIGYGGNLAGFRPGQGGNHGVLWNPGPSQVMHKAENKYEVGRVADEEEATQRQLKAILNKLMPQNFERLFEQVKAVNIDNAVTLTGVISQIFDIALTEPTFCEMYANFCFHLAGELPDFSTDNEKITFKRLLLNKCQEEFERGEREQEEADRVEEEGEVKQSEQEREERRTQARRRLLGNIRLIGELYKKKMVTERIMHACIKKLLGQYQSPGEEDIEALCKLMSTIGEIIDHPKAKEHMDAYFDIMAKLSNNMNLSSRVRFMLKDAIDLRKYRWQQRGKVEGLKKTEEVHRDAAQERQT